MWLFVTMCALYAYMQLVIDGEFGTYLGIDELSCDSQQQQQQQPRVQQQQ
jgi:hypothetical protein